MDGWRPLLLAAAAVFACAATAGAATMTIDDFNSGTMGLIVDDNIDYTHHVAGTLTGLPGVIGGQRDASLDFVSGPEYARVSINRNGSGYFSFAEDPGTNATATLAYGLGGNLNADLTGGGTNNALRFTFNTADLAGQLSVVFFSAATGGTSTWTGTTPSGLTGVNLDFDVAFNDPNWVHTSGGAALNQIDRILVTLDGARNGDYVLDRIQTVPEPMSLSLLAAGGLTLLRRRRRV